MKRTFFITTIIFVLSSAFTTAQDIVTYMNVHLTDGTVVQYEDSKVCLVSFLQLDMSDPIVIDSLAKLKQGDYNADSLWLENKGITNGKYFSISTRISTKDYIPQDVDYILINEDYAIFLHAFESDAFQGVISNGECSPTKLQSICGRIDLKFIKQRYPSYQYKISLYKKGNPDMDISECTNLKMFNSIYYENIYIPEERVKNPKPILSFIDDDGFAEATKNWKIIFDSCGVKPTMAIITDRVNKNKCITWETIDELQQIGFEFISHTKDHSNITTLTDSALIENLQSSINALKQHGCNSDFLVYPGNRHDEATDKIVSQLFKGAFWQGDRPNYLPLNNTAINRYSILNTSTKIQIKDSNGETQFVYPAKSDEILHAIIDEAIERGGWVVFMSHFYNSYSSGYHCDEEMRNAIIRLVRYARSKGVQIMTVGEAFENFKVK